MWIVSKQQASWCPDPPYLLYLSSSFLESTCKICQCTKSKSNYSCHIISLCPTTIQSTNRNLDSSNWWKFNLGNFWITFLASKTEISQDAFFPSEWIWYSLQDSFDFWAVSFPIYMSFSRNKCWAKIDNCFGFKLSCFQQAARLAQLTSLAVLPGSQALRTGRVTWDFCMYFEVAFAECCLSPYLHLLRFAFIFN